ncbi:5-formyltetrahydrofolate cyclo-ligase [Skermania sp. ID1734]|uniref:5-formyltetrahydrofolate cyclo-ligase n=1 Tax=Skermania sp. ID1734 TaxID=2597516 RepID=UPI00117E3D52|nr:5-formyltetrahydrofolate cyclo-ligase [Skermania sp. ID1734]TSD99706.1 5-formyltetrahydrofolate cyclo-ligase [Skermania sp. ID1734]
MTASPDRGHDGSPSPDGRSGEYPSGPHETKAQWRSAILRARRAVSPAVHAAEADALAVAAAGIVAAGKTVCAYVPVGTEPGSPSLLTALAHAGATVLLPVVRDLGPLYWGRFTGLDSLTDAPRGLREPTGDLLPPDAIATASLVLLPALAVDRRGVRLGRGAGYYDRSLELARGRLIAVVRDCEIVPLLPAQAHDRPVGWALSPNGGLTQLRTE